jgi:hypothetical protein
VQTPSSGSALFELAKVTVVKIILNKAYLALIFYLRNVISSSRPGGELNPGEDEVEGLKRLLTEVLIIFPFQSKLFFTAEYVISYLIFSFLV